MNGSNLLKNCLNWENAFFRCRDGEKNLGALGSHTNPSPKAPYLPAFAEFLLPRDFPVYEANGKPAMQLCDVRRKEFCKDWVEQCGLLLWLAGGAALLALLGLVKHLMCLAANYAHLRDQQKLLDLQLLQDLQDTELTTLGSKDRF
ncbi:neuronal membrane glycoprotein M6-b isoform X2 [Ixodes scapularis]